MAFWSLSVTIGNLWVLVVNAGVKNDAVIALDQIDWLRRDGIPDVLFCRLRVRGRARLWFGRSHVSGGGSLSENRLIPNAKSLQFARHDIRPITIRRRAGWTRMQDANDRRFVIGKNLPRTFSGEIADTDEPFGIEHGHDLAQMSIANSEEWLSLVWRQFVRCAVAAALFHECERTIVRDKMLREELICGAEAFVEEAPQTLAADFGAGTIETGDQPFRMLLPRRSDRSLIFNQSRTAAISPKGIPVCAMPNGPGFIPRKTTRFFPLA